MTLESYLVAKLKSSNISEGELFGYKLMHFELTQLLKKYPTDVRMRSIEFIFWLRWQVFIIGNREDGLLTPLAHGKLQAFRDVLFRIRPKDKDANYEQ